MITTFNEKIG